METLGIRFKGNIFQRPVITEAMCVKSTHEDRVRLTESQLVPRAMVWSNNDVINLDLEYDIGLPITMKTSREPIIDRNQLGPPNHRFALDVDRVLPKGLRQASRGVEQELQVREQHPHQGQTWFAVPSRRCQSRPRV